MVVAVRNWIPVVLVALSSGCAHIRNVAPDSTSIASLDAKVRHRATSLTLRNGNSYVARDVRVTLDSTSWRPAGLPDIRMTSTSNVREVSVKDHLRGAVDGLVLGFLIGAPLGAALIDNPNGPANETLNRVEAGAAGGVAFVVWGIPIGAIIGSRIHYRLAIQR